jgi:pimeloyl-ACP methyl ester carboxylesterase
VASFSVVLRSIVALVLLVSLSGCVDSLERRAVEGGIEDDTAADFYDIAQPIEAGAPGDIIRSERLLGAPDGSIAWRVVYHSVDVLGEDVPVSGIIVAPTGDAPSGGRPVVSWGHPTTGSMKDCAPSVGVDPFILMEGVKSLLKAGYVVAATDYPGMGIAGPNAYLIGVSEGHSVLDAARAARQIDEAGASDQLLLWGHSQGGHAALFAAQEAATYAPELKLQAVALAAPATQLAELLNDDIGTASGVTLASYAFEAYAEVYGPTTPGAELSSILTPDAVAATPGLAKLCNLGQHGQTQADAGKLVGNFLVNDPGSTEPWATLLTQNTPGAADIGVPIYFAQGLADDVINPTVGTAFVAERCAAGESVTFETFPGVTHGQIANRAVPRVLEFFNGALTQKPVAPTC